MPLDGSGSWVPAGSSWNPPVTGAALNSTDWIALLADLKTALSTAMFKDGQATPTANLPMGGFKLTGLAAGSAAGNSLRYEQGMQSLLTTAGDIIYASAANTPARLAAGTSGYVLTAAGAGLAPAWAAVSSPVVKNYLTGCGLTNGTDATNDINVSAGVCADSTNAVMITVAAMAGKQLDANWAVGAGAGMRNSAAAITNATYHIYAVAKADGTQDIYAHTSTTVATVITALQAETGGSSYVYARRIASIVRAGATLLAFTQDGDKVKFTTVPNDISSGANPGATAITETFTSVPTGITVDVECRWIVTNTGSGVTVYGLLSELTGTDTTPAITASDISDTATATGGVQTGVATKLVRTDTSARIRARLSASDASVSFLIAPVSYIDRRGRDG